MTTRAEVAAKVRRHREKHPELYCHACLWRVVTAYAVVPCPRHPKVELVPGENRLADFDDVSQRTEVVHTEDCPACKGVGYVYVPGCDCRQTPEGCVHPERDVLCGRCEGTGDVCA